MKGSRLFSAKLLAAAVYLLAGMVPWATASTVDWQFLHELNREAEGLWSRLLECANGDAELARLRYAQAGELCAGDPGQSQKLQADLSALHANVADFQATTFLKPDAPNSPRSFIAHPLFGQILLETLAVRLNYWGWDPPVPTQYRMRYLSLLNPGRVLFVESPAGDGLTQGFDVLTEQAKGTRFREVDALNALILAELSFAEGCGPVGLWPEQSCLVYVQERFRSFEGQTLMLERRPFRPDQLQWVEKLTESPAESLRLTGEYRELGRKYGLEKRPICRTSAGRRFMRVIGMPVEVCDYIRD